VVTRRQVLAGVGAATVLGFNSTARAWSTGGGAETSAAFHRVPGLDGTVLTGPSATAAYAKDAGNIVYETPIAVLRPGSVRDIQKMVRFCQRLDIFVAARGQGHTTFGQALVRGGLVIDMGTINAVHSINAGSADVGAGLKWHDLLIQTFARGLKPPSLTGFLNLSIGGTLSVGGISPTYRGGAQIDYVRALDVVTGEGELVTCSERHNRDLFEMALGGLGQCGIITRAVLDLEPAPPLARVYTANYTDNAMFFADMRELLGREELDDIFNFGLPNPAGGWISQLNSIKLFHPSDPPDDEELLGGLNLPTSAFTPVNVPFLTYAFQVDGAIDYFRQIGLWENVQHPWIDTFLPDRTVEQYVADVVPNLAPEDVGMTGFLLLFPHRRSEFTRPLLRLPNGGGEWTYLFNVLTAAPAPGVDKTFEQRMLARNRRLFEKARRMGGTRYPIDSVPFSRTDWVHHYGDQWPRFARLKRQFDPAGILTPGPDIFS
jgi:cytokinin dehydrogenase